MPNWCEVRMSAVLPTRNVGKFKDLFLSWNGEENKSKKRYFARSFLNDFNEVKSNGKGMSLVTVDFDCAWSIWSCMFAKATADRLGGGYVNEKTCPSLDTVVKELGIRRLIGQGDEPGISFDELVTFDDRTDDEVQLAERDMWPDPESLELEPDDVVRQDGGKENQRSGEEPER